MNMEILMIMASTKKVMIIGGGNREEPGVSLTTNKN
jgi:siroheme synthase (precorrin-2 oxidase/ferrochelatase)